MPYTSKAQQRKFHALLAEGKISKATVDEFDKATDFSKLPETSSKRLRDHLKHKKHHAR
jgi:hypothetical protein